MNYKKNIQMRNIIKIYPPENIALDDVSIEIKHGEIHSIIGENGAGKSTLMKVLYGLENPNEGVILIGDKKTRIQSPNDAVSNGIGMVHQEFMLIPEYTVLENVVLGVEPKKHRFFLNLDSARKKLNKILIEMNFNISLDDKIADISVAAQQKVEIIKQLYRDANVLILDEPTAVLTPQESEDLFVLLDKIKNDGKTIIFISHKLDEVLKISDRITIMRKGKLIWTKENKNLTKVDLANAMVGRDVLFTTQKSLANPGKKVLELRDVSTGDNLQSNSDLKNVDLSVRKKEIVGIAGVEGNGQYELVNAIIGIVNSKGDILVNDQNINNMSIREKRKLIAYISQDRKTVGSSQNSNIVDNTLMTHHYRNKDLVSSKGILNIRKINKYSSELLRKYQVNTDNIHVSIGSLSGGNQQKVIIGREFELDCDLLIIDQPVRGLDVGSIEYIHKKIIEKRDSGVACLLISADLDELFNLSDRILVMHKGEIVAEKVTTETTKEEIGEYMLGARR